MTGCASVLALHDRDLNETMGVACHGNHEPSERHRAGLGGHITWTDAEAEPALRADAEPPKLYVLSPPLPTNWSNISEPRPLTPQAFVEAILCAQERVGKPLDLAGENQRRCTAEFMANVSAASGEDADPRDLAAVDEERAARGDATVLVKEAFVPDATAAADTVALSAKPLPQSRPKVGVGVIARKPDGSLLMMQRAGSHGAGTWSVPGGHLERGETVAECAARELLEETGIDVAIDDVRELDCWTLTEMGDAGAYVTLYAAVDVDQAAEVEIREPTKCSCLWWASNSAGSEGLRASFPLFAPLANLLDKGIDPFTVDVPAEPVASHAEVERRREEARRYMAKVMPLKPLRIEMVRVGDHASMPAYATTGAAGLDLHAERGCVLYPGQRMLVPTGWAVAIPPGYEGQVRPRSGLAHKHGVTVLNAPGTIDSDYRGPLGVILVSPGAHSVIAPGDRIAQLVIVPCHMGEPVAVDALDDTERGAGGWGSTGR